jgi:ComF family protein
MGNSLNVRNSFSIKRILYGIFPKTCPMCDKVIRADMYICSRCEKKLKYVDEPKCKKCGKPILVDEQEYCMDCTKQNHLYEQGISAFVYSDEVKQSIYRFKYHNRRDYSGFYGMAVAKHFYKDIQRWNGDVLIPVPIHHKKYIQRGYNQAKLLAKDISKWTNIPIDSHLLQRVINTKPQKEMNIKGRSKNLESAFKITENVVKYKKVIIVDDIYTTGSTIDACAKVLYDAGVEKIYFISLSIGAGI